MAMGVILRAPHAVLALDELASDLEVLAQQRLGLLQRRSSTPRPTRLETWVLAHKLVMLHGESRSLAGFEESGDKRRRVAC